jgi:hypothetical protein
VGFNDFIEDDFIPEGDGQVVAGSASLPDTVALETEEKTLEMLQERLCESRMNVMLLNHWVSTSETPECVSRKRL